MSAWKRIAERTAEGPTEGVILAHGERLVWLWHGANESLSYDPSADAWTRTSPIPCSARLYPAAASAGSSVIVWGGEDRFDRFTGTSAVYGDGFALGSDGAWKPIADKGAPRARSASATAWTGDALLVWGGSGGRQALGDGAAYLPAEDRWRPIAARGAPSPRWGSYRVFTGTELLLFGGLSYDRAVTNGADLYDGFAYAPAQDRWRAIAPLPGKHERAAYAGGMVRLGDGALFVRRDDPGGDIATTSCFRYVASEDRWSRVASPPESRGDIQLLACGESALLRIGSSLLEYLADRDAWAVHPDVPGEVEVTLVVVGRAVLALEAAGPTRAGFRLDLDAGEPRAELPIAPPPPPSVAALLDRSLRERRWRAVEHGPAVSAVAIDAAVVAVGHMDGTVRVWSRLAGLGPLTEARAQTVRHADARRVHALALHRGTVVVLVGTSVEVLARDGSTTTSFALPFDAHALAQRGDRLVVAGVHDLASCTFTEAGWRMAARVECDPAFAITEVKLAADGSQVLLCRAPRAKLCGGHGVSEVETRDATSLALAATFRTQDLEYGTASAIVGAPFAAETKKRAPTRPVPSVYVAGARGGTLARMIASKPKPVEMISTGTGWPSMLVASGDGANAACRTTGSGVAVFDLALKRCVFALDPFAWDDMAALSAQHPAPAFLSDQAAETFMAKTRWRGATSALALDERGDAGVIGTSFGAALVFDRATARLDALTAHGHTAWQTARSELLGELSFWGASADIAHGVVRLVDSTGRYGEIDVATGAWTWGPMLDMGDLRALERPAYAPRGRVTRAGDVITATDYTRGAFHYATGAKADAQPTAKADDASGSLDGVHYAVPSGEGIRWRRWQVYALGTATVVRTLESVESFTHLAMVPGGRAVSWAFEEIAFWDADGRVDGPYLAHGAGIVGVCPSLDGEYVIAWDRGGTFRRWRVS